MVVRGKSGQGTLRLELAWRAEWQCLSVRPKTNQKTEPRHFGKLYLRVCRRRRRRRSEAEAEAVVSSFQPYVAN